MEEHFLKNGQSVILGVKNDGWDVLDMEWECDYSGNVSTDEDAFGVLLDKDGSFKEVFKIVKRLIQKFLNEHTVLNQTLQIECNLTNREDPKFIDHNGPIQPKQFRIRKTKKASSFCCLSPSNMLKSFGKECPETSEDTVNLIKSCNFTPFIEQKCVVDFQQRKNSRYCKTSQTSCILQDFYYSPCNSEVKMPVCDMTKDMC